MFEYVAHKLGDVLLMSLGEYTALQSAPRSEYNIKGDDTTPRSNVCEL